MRMFMTDGMFGRCLEQIGPETDDPKKILAELQEWKSSEMNKRFYKIEPYDRFTFKDSHHEMAIDFGDYSTFMLVTGADSSMFKFSSPD